jgi:hypothetical protein
MSRFSALDVEALIGKARDALARLDAADREERKRFLTALKFRQRQ